MGYVLVLGFGSFCYAIYDATKGQHTRVKAEVANEPKHIN